MKKLLLVAACAAVCAMASAQEEKVERLDSVVVSASRAGKNTPVTYTNIGRDVLKSANPASSLPMALNLMPSVVTYNEGGTGLGNSAMTIRGSKGSQINVTLNGITLNDAESQEVFWVNIPSLMSLISGIQVQRGLGTSASGAGAFGASINMNTAFAPAKPQARVDYSAGSYNTFLTTFSGSTGIDRHGFYASAAFSRGDTDGYIRNAFVQSQSAFVAIGHLSERNSVRLTYLMGKQRSGITWDGIDLEQYKKDRTYNGAGEYYDELGNVYYYPNQTDNYAQHHLQLNYTRALTDALAWSTTLNYTRGDGYDEYYKMNRKLKNFGFTGLPDGTPAKSDMIYRKVMDNDLWVLNSDVKYRSHRLNLIGGVNLSSHRGGHWGEVLWAKVLGDDYDCSGLDWYHNDGLKYDLGAFGRVEFRPLDFLTAYAELQYRGVKYTVTGKDDDWLEYGANPADIMDWSRFWNFFNPRAGVTVANGPWKTYFSAALGHREPGRSDIKENIKGSGADIVPEKMLDLELGWSYQGKAFSASSNLYLMEYWDMLLETGKLSDSGYALKENMPRAWRRGLELVAAWKALPWLTADANATLSVNEISDYTSFIPYTDYSATHAVNYGKTTMLLSPSVIGMFRLTAGPFKRAYVTADVKYVGKQFIDNSMREEMAIPAYTLVNLSASKDITLGRSVLTLYAYVTNLMNSLYYASGWRWEEYDPATGDIYSGVGVYPQAPRNFMLKASLSF